MRNRDYFLPSVTSILVFGLVWFLSCAHQNRMREEADAGFESTAENAEQTQAQPEVAQTEVAPNEAQPQGEGEIEKTTPTDSSVEATKTEAENVAPQEKTEDVASAQAAPEVTPEPILEPKAEVPPVDQVQISEPIKTPRTWLGVVPKIPSKALKRKGANLNRFYFSRLGDTPKSVSQLIYSDLKHAKKLTAWNGKVWAPGKLLFYSSPVDPADKKMRSFYKERQVVPEEYRVSSGDWLTRIAKKKLGNAKSWKEIAVVNGLKRPNDIEVGQLLAIYPKDLLASPSASEEALAKNESVGNLPMIEAPEKSGLPQLPPSKLLNERPREVPAPTIPNPQEATGQPSAAMPQEAAPAEGGAEPPAEGNPEAAQKVSSGGTNWDQVIEQNSVAILIAAAVVVLLLALAARKKRQRLQASSQKVEPTAEDYSENTPSKFRKR